MVCWLVHLYQSSIPILLQVETLPWEGHLPPHFSPVGILLVMQQYDKKNRLWVS